MRPLNRDEEELIHDLSLEVRNDIGVIILSRKTLEMLGDAGAVVDFNSDESLRMCIVIQ